ncbi:MAG: NYN domain-containing protein [bacterium]|nr:NYN domain-containing protein [bacterium]
MEKETKKVAIFYDGWHVFRKLLHRKKGPQHFNYTNLNNAIEQYVKDTLNVEYKLCYKGWYEGIEKSFFDISSLNRKTDVEEMRSIILKYYNVHTNHYRLSEAGVETTFLPIEDHGEKGVDVALAVAVSNRVEMLDLNLVIILTNDSDFAPLIHNIKKRGVETITISFDDRATISDALKRRALHTTTYDQVIKHKKAATTK